MILLLLEGAHAPAPPKSVLVYCYIALRTGRSLDHRNPIGRATRYLGQIWVSDCMLQQWLLIVCCSSGF